jgi:hypothetical protein
MDWAQHVMARFDAAHAKDSSEDGKSRERDDAMDVRHIHFKHV